MQPGGQPIGELITGMRGETVISFSGSQRKDAGGVESSEP